MIVTKDIILIQNLDVVNDIHRGDWYMNWSHEFRTYAVVFDVDVMKKVIHLFGMNEGSFGSPWIFSVPYKEFSQKNGKNKDMLGRRRRW